MRKFFLLLACGVMALTAQAQKTYQIHGTTDKATTEIYVVEMGNRRAKTDTIAVTDGKFSMQGENETVKFIRISPNNNPLATTVVVLEGNLEVDLANRKAVGNAENEGLSQWWARHATIENQIMALSGELREVQKKYREQGVTQLPDSVFSPYLNKYNELSEQINAIAKNCCTENPNSLFPAVLLMNANLSNADWITLSDSKAACLELPLFKGIKSRIEGWRRQEVGRMFTDLEMADTTGTMRHLSDFVGKGKYVLVDFWASWCGPCRQEMPEVKALYEKYHDRGFDIVGVSFDNKREAWVNCINSMGLPWHHISDLKGWECAASSVYGINSIPATLLIGPDGKIVAAGLRAGALAEKLAEIFP